MHGIADNALLVVHVSLLQLILVRSKRRVQKYGMKINAKDDRKINIHGRRRLCTFLVQTWPKIGTFSFPSFPGTSAVSKCC